jgi:hypothetical protein
VILRKFNETLLECVNELKCTFPELEGTIDERYSAMALDDPQFIVWFQEKVLEFSVQLTARDELVFKKSVHPQGFFLFPDIDFVQLWKKTLTASTKTAIWKYVNVLMLLLSHYQLSTCDFESTFRKWDELLDEADVAPAQLQDMKLHAENIVKLMSNLSTEDDAGASEDDAAHAETETETPTRPSDRQEDDDIQNDPFIQKLQQSKIARFAEELSKEIDIGELGLDVADMTSEKASTEDTAASVKNMFASFGKDPQKLMRLVQSVGTKIQTKLSDGDINQTELVEEAQNLMSSMKDSTSFQKMFKKQRRKRGSKGGAGGMDPAALMQMITKQMGGVDSSAAAAVAAANPQAMQQAMAQMMGGGSGSGDIMGQIASMLQQTDGTQPKAGGGQRGSATSAKDRLRRKLKAKQQAQAQAQAQAQTETEEAEKIAQGAKHFLECGAKAEAQGAKHEGGATAEAHGTTDEAHGATEEAHGATEEAHGATEEAHGATEEAHGATEEAHGATEEAAREPAESS